MKIVLFGGNGQVGFELQRSLALLGEVIIPGLGQLPRIDVTEFGALESFIANFRPDVVVNAAAYTAVDAAESDRDAASRINADAPGVMARAVARLGGAIVHYSTDYVFDGGGDQPRVETDVTAPLNHYGMSKRDGEVAVMQANPRHLILRTSWVYATHGKNFPKTILRLARERDEISVVADQFGAPTGAPLIADATAYALMGLGKDPAAFGLYHLVAGGEASWHDVAEFVCAQAREFGLIDRVPKIKAIASSGYPTPARRPQNGRLSTLKFAKAFHLVLPDWRLGLAHMIRDLASLKS